MVEFLVKKILCWLDDLTPQEREDKGMTESYVRRTVPGDIVVVKPDNHQWGKTELVRYDVVKRPDIPFEEAHKYLYADFECHAVPFPRSTELISKVS